MSRRYKQGRALPERMQTMQVKQAGDPRRYEVRDAECLGRRCFDPGRIATKKMLSIGYRVYTGEHIDCCLTRQRDGCRWEPYSTHHEDLARARKEAGWEVVE